MAAHKTHASLQAQSISQVLIKHIQAPPQPQSLGSPLCLLPPATHPLNGLLFSLFLLWVTLIHSLCPLYSLSLFHYIIFILLLIQEFYITYSSHTHFLVLPVLPASPPLLTSPPKKAKSNLCCPCTQWIMVALPVASPLRKAGSFRTCTCKPPPPSTVESYTSAAFSQFYSSLPRLCLSCYCLWGEGIRSCHKKPSMSLFLSTVSLQPLYLAIQ